MPHGPEDKGREQERVVYTGTTGGGRRGVEDFGVSRIAYSPEYTVDQKDNMHGAPKPGDKANMMKSGPCRYHLSRRHYNITHRVTV